jgi:hypothetical protein
MTEPSPIVLGHVEAGCDVFPNIIEVGNKVTYTSVPNILAARAWGIYTDRIHADTDLPSYLHAGGN